MAPEGAGDAAPEGCEETVFPVDDADVVLVVDGIEDFLGYGLWLEQHGVVEVAMKEGCVYEAWTDIRELDVQSSGVGLLFQRLQVDILHSFGGRVAWGRAEAFGASNRGDGCDVSAAFVGKVAIGFTNHSGEAQAIGIHSGKFDIFLKLTVLFSDTRGVEEEVHASQTTDERLEASGGVVFCDVNLFYCCNVELLEFVDSSGCHTDGPAFLHEKFGNFSSDA